MLICKIWQAFFKKHSKKKHPPSFTAMHLIMQVDKQRIPLVIRDYSQLVNEF